MQHTHQTARAITVFARFTPDMVATLASNFARYEKDSVVTLEVTCRGLWLVNPHNNSRQFLGQAVLEEPCDSRPSGEQFTGVLQ